MHFGKPSGFFYENLYLFLQLRKIDLILLLFSIARFHLLKRPFAQLMLIAKISYIQV